MDAPAEKDFEPPRDLLGPSYCISLAHRVDRREFCRRQFASEGLSVNFFDAIVPTESARFPTRGAHGCFLSHLKILETVLEESEHTPITHATIFEDDVLLPTGFLSIVDSVMPLMDGLDWHILYWGTSNDPPLMPVEGRSPLATIAPESPIIGKQAYTINLTTVPALIRHLYLAREAPRPSYSDGMFHEFRLHRDLPAHTHTLRPARQASFDSNITPKCYSWVRSPVRAIKRQLQYWTR